MELVACEPIYADLVLGLDDLELLILTILVGFHLSTTHLQKWRFMFD